MTFLTEGQPPPSECGRTIRTKLDLNTNNRKHLAHQSGALSQTQSVGSLALVHMKCERDGWLLLEKIIGTISSHSAKLREDLEIDSLCTESLHCH